MVPGTAAMTAALGVVTPTTPEEVGADSIWTGGAGGDDGGDDNDDVDSPDSPEEVDEPPGDAGPETDSLEFSSTTTGGLSGGEEGGGEDAVAPC